MAIRKYVENGKALFEVYVNAFDASGRRTQRKRRGITTLRKAETIEFELQRELADFKDRPITYCFGEWVEKCLKNLRGELAATTTATYEAQIKRWVYPLWKNRDLAAISKSDAYELIFNQCQFPTEHTRRNVFKMTKRMFQLAVEDGLIDRNPCLGIKVRVAEVDQKVLTNAEVEKFLSHAKLYNHHFYPIWIVALMTGMRSGEMFALKWTDVDFESKTISVTKQWTSKAGFHDTTKTRRNRIVPLSDALASFLKEWKLKHRSEFVLPHLKEWKGGEQARVTRDFCEGIGITSVKFHDLRATFITSLLSRGESLACVMSIVGHRELKTTNCYLRKAGIDVRGGTDKLGYEIPQTEEAEILAFPGQTR